MSNNRYFYIYLKQVSEKFKDENVLKLGCTINLYSRYQSYKTSSINECIFIKLFRFTAKYINNIKKECNSIEKIYQKEYEKFHITNNKGGNEFYKESIKDLIEEFTNNNFKEYNPEIFNNQDLINKEIKNSCHKYKKKINVSENKTDKNINEKIDKNLKKSVSETDKNIDKKLDIKNNFEKIKKILLQSLFLSDKEINKIKESIKINETLRNLDNINYIYEILNYKFNFFDFQNVMPYLMNAKVGYPKWSETNEPKYKDTLELLLKYNENINDLIILCYNIMRTYNYQSKSLDISLNINYNISADKLDNNLECYLLYVYIQILKKQNDKIKLEITKNILVGINNSTNMKYHEIIMYLIRGL